MKDNKRLSANGAPRVDVDEVRTFYEELPSIYEGKDPWHQVTHEWVTDFIQASLSDGILSGASSVLNLGSGGMSHGLPENNLTHVDLTAKGFHDGQKYLLADIHNLPLESGTFDTCLCVGSVLNYCDAARLILEVGRVLMGGGTFVLEFESSYSPELFRGNGFREQAAIVDTFYQDRVVQLWAYSERYIRDLLEASGIRLVSRSSKHHLSALALLMGARPEASARFHVWDRLFSKVPIVRRYCSNVIYLCRKDP